MSDILVKHWIGQHVIVTLRSSTPAELKGAIAQADDAFLILEQSNKRRLLIPFTSVLHVKEDTGQP